VLPDRGELTSDLEEAGLEVHIRSLSVVRRQHLSARGMATLAIDAARDARALGELIRRRRIALVHSNTSAVLGGAAAAALARVPHIWHVREIYSGFGRLWRGYRRVLGTARALPCVSEATAAQFDARTPTHVIYDGLAIDARRAPQHDARRALGIDPDKPLIAVLGRISEWKGQDVLVRALAEPALAARGALGLIAGEPWPAAGHRRQAVLDLADELGVSSRLHLVGFREDVSTIYGAADLVAVPSTAPDPLPGAAIEAAAAGCAVLASDHGGLPEIIRDRQTGRLVVPGDSRALAGAAAELLDDPDERERLGSAAAADVRARFTQAQLLDRVQTLYDELT
jgi:glycosyltransferase involved in cell wall biosynthesis